MAWGNRAFRVDRRLGTTQRDLLEISEWEAGEMEWKDDQVCIGWLGRLLGALLWHTVGNRGREPRRKGARPEVQ